MVPTLMDGRWPLLLPRHRAERAEWTRPPYWEPERLDAMSRTIGPGDLVLDVGAEEGDMGGLYASWGADVVLVEPNPRVWPNIRAVFDANGLAGRVRGTWVGFCGDRERTAGHADWLAEHDGRCDTGEGGVWPACASGPVIDDHGFLVLPERPDCPVATVDLLAERYGTPTVVTIDVEGAELTVLRGAEGVLAARPTVFVSIHTDLAWIAATYPGDTGDAVRAFMAARGYEATHLATDHEEHWQFDPARPERG